MMKHPNNFLETLHSVLNFIQVHNKLNRRVIKVNNSCFHPVRHYYHLTSYPLINHCSLLVLNHQLYSARFARRVFGWSSVLIDVMTALTVWSVGLAPLHPINQFFSCSSFASNPELARSCIHRAINLSNTGFFISFNFVARSHFITSLVFASLKPSIPVIT